MSHYLSYFGPIEASTKPFSSINSPFGLTHHLGVVAPAMLVLNQNNSKLLKGVLLEGIFRV